MYYRRSGIGFYILLGVGALLVLNKAGLDLLKPNRASDTYDDKKPKYPVDKKNLSYSKDAYERLCVRLVHAMDTDSVDGTYEDEIYAVFGYMHTTDDVKELYNVFGSRTYSGDEWGQWQIEADPKYNLQTWLNKELDAEEKSKISSILKKKGITWKV